MSYNSVYRKLTLSLKPSTNTPVNPLERAAQDELTAGDVKRIGAALEASIAPEGSGGPQADSLCVLYELLLHVANTLGAEAVLDKLADALVTRGGMEANEARRRGRRMLNLVTERLTGEDSSRGELAGRGIPQGPGARESAAASGAAGSDRSCRLSTGSAVQAGAEPRNADRRWIMDRRGGSNVSMTTYLPLALALAFTAAAPAQEQYAAIAMHYSDGGTPRATVSFGFAAGAATLEEAVEAAMQECVEAGGKPDTREKDVKGSVAGPWGFHIPGFVCSVVAPHRLTIGGLTGYNLLTTACVALVKETDRSGDISFWSGHAMHREELRRELAKIDAAGSANHETLALVCSDDKG